MSVPIATYKTEQSLRVWGKNLTNLDLGDVTEGATITVFVVDEARNVLSEETGGVETDTNNWYCDITLPEQEGMYWVHIHIAVGETVWKDSERIYVAYAP